MDQATANAEPLSQPTDFPNAVIRSLLKESNALKLKTGHLEIKEKAMAELQDEKDTLKTRINEWRQLSNNVVRLEERIAGMLNTEKEEMQVALVKKEARIGELELEAGRIGGALEARIARLLRWKSQQEQDTRRVGAPKGDARKTAGRGSRLQAERSARDSLTGIAQGIKQSLQSIEENNKEVAKRFTDFSKNVGRLAGRLGLGSLSRLVFLWFLNKVWDWGSSYLANVAATRTSVSVHDKAQGWQVNHVGGSVRHGGMGPHVPQTLAAVERGPVRASGAPGEPCACKREPSARPCATWIYIPDATNLLQSVFPGV